MSERAPEYPTSSPYLTWLRTLSPTERDSVTAQAAVLTPALRELVEAILQMDPAIPLGVWLQALRQVWQDLEQELSPPSASSSHQTRA